MATIEKRKTGYRAKVYVGRINGKAKFESISAPTRREVAQQAQAREAELSGKSLPSKTLSEAFTKYADTISPEHRGERWELLRLKALARFEMAGKQVAKIGADDIIAWRDARLKSVSKATVLREMNLLRSVFEACRKEWRWVRENPMKDVTRPRQPPSRKRRVSQDEIDALVSLSGLKEIPQTQTQMAVMAFLFAIETAMRSSEILGLSWECCHARHVVLPNTKNGDSREVPLSPKARSIIDALRGNEKPFDIANGTRDALFRKLVKQAGIKNLTFHDSRAEAIYRLSKKLGIMDLARVIGHRDLKSLMIYYNESADALADRL
jgi:integrase